MKGWGASAGESGFDIGSVIPEYQQAGPLHAALLVELAKRHVGLLLQLVRKLGTAATAIQV